ncbi:MAG: hypothetical protein M3167_12995 [Acidobacteriota bacterium]|nr:hypothetical protein [Acidobacteriota bacterium]
MKTQRGFRGRAGAASILSAVLAFACGCRPGPPVASLRISPATVRLGYPESAPLHFDWSPTAALGNGGTPTVFVHLLDERRGVRRTFDHPFPEAWAAGKPVSYDLELYQSALGAALPPGQYAVTAGLYDPSSGNRWALDAGGIELGRREYRVGTVEVPAPAPASAPRFDFSGEWGPLEPDPSVQILARRRLHGPASLRFAARPGAPGKVRLALTVHGAALAVESDCAPGAEGRLEPGYHWLGFDLNASGTCAIRFPDVRSRVNGPAESLDAAARHAEPATSLDVAAWRPPGR